MKNKIPESNKSVHSSTFNSRLAAYSATAAAALLAAPVLGAATIQNINSPSGTFSIDNTSGNNSFASFTAGLFKGNLKLQPGSIGNVNTAQHFNYFLADIRINSGGKLVGVNNSRAKLLELSSAINGQARFFGSGLLAVHKTYNHPANHTVNSGSFLKIGGGAQTGYVGFKDVFSNKTYYGWLRVKVTANANNIPTGISLVASANDPSVFGAYALKGTGIKAGETAPTPEPSVAALGGLALLACGAAGVREMRRRRQHPETIKAE